MGRVIRLGLLAIIVSVLMGAGSLQAQSWSAGGFCATHEYLCTDNRYNYQNGLHIGHDEPAVLFYSNVAGAGNSAIYNFTLPKDPPKLPNQAGTGGTFNFQLHPTFWFGMAVCDTQSFPEFTQTCNPDTDANIFDNSDSNASDYIGKHPGAGFVEMQFYPPGWVTWPNGGTSCDARHWCAALNIDSFNFDPNHGVDNNDACVNGPVGRESVNFAFITKSGQADTAAAPGNTQHFLPNLRTDFLMNPGDNITLDMHDTADGLEVIVYDNTLRTKGSMTAGTANGFAQVEFQPNSGTCNTSPYAFHPMYATSGPHTRVPWAVHSYNISFSDEIGHWDYCSSVDLNSPNLVCTQSGKSATDDDFCFPASYSSRVKVGGCTDEDLDFDGTSYLPDWPGTASSASMDKQLHAAPITFGSPLLNPTTPGALASFDMFSFEADMPAFEPNPPCDSSAGTGCTNPPAGAAFYPFFSTGTQTPPRAFRLAGTCAWQFGGASIAGSTNDFGGVSQYGSLLGLEFPEPGGAQVAFEDFRSASASNPCEATPPSLTLPTKPIAFGTVVVGRHSAVHPLRIANPSIYPMTLGITLPGDYQLATGRSTTCPNPPAPLAPGARCQYGVTFMPSVSGPDNGTATIESNASNASLTVSLTGTGR